MGRTLTSWRPVATGIAIAVNLATLSLTSPAAPPLKLGDADVVDYGHWEVWTTFDYVRDSSSKQAWTSPRFEVISGIFPRVELALETAYANERQDGDTQGSFGFLALQPKVRWLEESATTPAISTSLLLEVPFEERNGPLQWTDREWAPSFAVQKHFGATLLVGQVKGCFDSSGDALFWRYGMDVMHDATQNLTLLAEIYAETPRDADESDQLNFRLGCKYRCGSWGKIYLGAGRSLLPAADSRPQLNLCAGLKLDF